MFFLKRWALQFWYGSNWGGLYLQRSVMNNLKKQGGWNINGTYYPTKKERGNNLDATE